MSAATADNGDDEFHPRNQQPMLASQRHKAGNNTPIEGKRTGKSGGYFTLGYKEGFSQWWANIPAAKAEHAVMSFIPYLKQPPTHTQTGATVPSETTPTASYSDKPADKASAVKTHSNSDPYGPRQWHSTLVQLSGKNRALNEFSVERIDEDVDQNLVMLHGYGAGLGFFYRNFEGLSRVEGWKVYALDLLGMGRSSRPPFKLHSKDRQSSITEAENWFIDALEEWRIRRKIERFTLLGHSLGGYMAVAYALKYPGHLNKLVLASPVGIPEDPYAVNAEMPEPNNSTMANEFTQNQQEDVKNNLNPQISDSAKVGDNNNFLNARSKEQQDGKAGEKPPLRKPLPKWLTYLWDANISPFSVVRWSGPLGPRFVSGWTSRRFSHLGAEEAQYVISSPYPFIQYPNFDSRDESQEYLLFMGQNVSPERQLLTTENIIRALHTYAYSLFKQRGSGEYALAYILAPGAFARSPLIRRIQGVGRQYLQLDGSTTSSIESAARKRETGIPVVLMYGENDWMDVAGGYAAEQKMEEEKARLLKTASAEEKQAERGSAKVVVIKNAGHHVYLDGWEEFNEVMCGEMQDVSKHAKSA